MCQFVSSYPSLIIALSSLSLVTEQASLLTFSSQHVRLFDDQLAMKHPHLAGEFILARFWDSFPSGQSGALAEIAEDNHL